MCVRGLIFGLFVVSMKLRDDMFISYSICLPLIETWIVLSSVCVPLSVCPSVRPCVTLPLSKPYLPRTFASFIHFFFHNYHTY